MVSKVLKKATTQNESKDIPFAMMLTFYLVVKRKKKCEQHWKQCCYRFKYYLKNETEESMVSI